ATQHSNWGEDVIIATASGQTETTVVRQKGPPGRLAADWFGDRLLTHRLEVVDFFTGDVVDVLDLNSTLAADSHR
ncbi:WD40 repeat domain-containing protein, partial [Pseudomonas frederiksbergensis]|nr:WD40 repeat domain-containing protein [Pseudomonas frederiksbergensis]